MKIQVTSLGISRDLGLIGGPSGFNIEFRSLAAFLCSEQVRIVGQRQIDGLIRCFGQIWQRRRRFQITGFIADKRNVIFFTRDQSGARRFQVALCYFQSGFRLRDIGTGQIPDFETVAGRFQIY